MQPDLGHAHLSAGRQVKRVYEIDPLYRPKCQREMRVIAFLEAPQADVVEKILRHCGLWHSSRAPPANGDFVHDEPRELVFVAEDAICAEADAFAHDAADRWYRQPPEDGPRELTYVDEDTFWREF